MLELADKDIKTVVLTVFHMVKNLRRDMKNISKTQKVLLEMKTTMPEIKNMFERINIRLFMAKKKNSKLEDIITETIQNERHIKKNKRALVSCVKMSSNLIHV